MKILITLRTLTALVAISLATALMATIAFPGPEQILKNAGIEATPDGITKAFAHESAFVRQAAATLAGERQMTAAVPHLQRLLEDPSDHVRLSAAGSLLALGNTDGVPLLESELQHKSIFRAAEAAKQLTRGNDTRGAAELARRLETPDTPVTDRTIAAHTLGNFLRFGAVRDVVRDDLIRALVSDPSAEVRLAVANALALDPSEETRRAFIQAAQKETDEIVRGVLQRYVEGPRNQKEDRP